MRISLPLFISLLFIPGALLAGPYEDGLAAEKAKDYSSARSYYEKAAEADDASAMSRLGRLYYFGLGLQQDYIKALELFREAAELGDPSGQAYLGRMLYYGRGTEKDFAKGLAWSRKSADQGDPVGEITLGLFYEEGNGVNKNSAKANELFRKAAKKFHEAAAESDSYTWLGYIYRDGKGATIDYEEAVKWYRMAADMGIVYSESTLGWFYLEGKGVKKNYVASVKWYRRAAEQGDAYSQTNVGRAYEIGRGVRKSYAEALKWYRLAADQGFGPAESYLTSLNEKTKGLVIVQKPDSPAITTNKMRFMMDQIAADAAKKALAAQTAESKGEKSKPKAIFSDVDRPKYKNAENPHDFAIVIGVEKYANDLPDAQFAERDAQAVRKHLVALGYPKRNIKFLKGSRASRSNLAAYIEEWLPRKVTSDSRVFFYFSGHGSPDLKSNQAYLVPSDGNPAYLKKTSYPLTKLYASLNALKAKQVIVALDSCFSGIGGRSVLPEGTRPLVTTVNTSVSPGGKIVLFAATSPSEITSTLKDEGHGIFTYYFLKGLNEAAKSKPAVITARELYEYLLPKVEDAANTQNRDQTPVLDGAVESEIVRFR